MKLLALDTATEACSCALLMGETVIERSIMTPRRHAELILPMIDDVMSEAGLRPQALDAVVMGCGPGSFTGVRIACGVAQGIAFAARIPIIPISSLAALAQAAYQTHGVTHVLSAIDARMGEVYWGEYVLGENQCMKLLGEEKVCAPENITIHQTTPAYAVGSGWDSYLTSLIKTAESHILIKVAEDIRYPQSVAMLPLAAVAFQYGLVIPPEMALPVYLRNKVVHGMP
jgi:tRNA threonylcarbamoyladenosine biosynthesis protein TsaB